MKTETPSQEINRLATYLEGMADASKNDRLASSAEWLRRLSRQICAQGYIGCYGGEGCDSDHK